MCEEIERHLKIALQQYGNMVELLSRRTSEIDDVFRERREFHKNQDSAILDPTNDCFIIVDVADQ